MKTHQRNFFENNLLFSMILSIVKFCFESFLTFKCIITCYVIVHILLVFNILLIGGCNWL